MQITHKIFHRNIYFDIGTTYWVSFLVKTIYVNYDWSICSARHQPLYCFFQYKKKTVPLGGILTLITKKSLYRSIKFKHGWDLYRIDRHEHVKKCIF